jgi:hypothetical protein
MFLEEGIWVGQVLFPAADAVCCALMVAWLDLVLLWIGELDMELTPAGGNRPIRVGWRTRNSWHKSMNCRIKS